MKKIFLSAFLAVMMVMLILVSCQTGTVPSDETQRSETARSTEPEETDGAGIDTTPGLDIPEGLRYDGYTYTVFTAATYNDNFKFQIDYSPDLVDAAAFERNAAVEELLGVTVEAKEATAEDIYAELSMALMSEAYSPYDLVVPHCYLGIASILSDGLLYDWDELSVDFSKPWWNQSMSTNLKICGKQYIVSSDLCVTWQGVNALIFNKEMLGILNLGKDLYQTVYDGEWTLDLMNSLISQNITSDINGDKFMDINDQYGLLIPFGYPIDFMYASNIKTTSSDENGRLVLDFSYTKMVDFVQKMYDLGHSDSTLLVRSRDQLEMMSGGRFFLALWDIGSYSSDLRQMQNLRFGLLPLPKYDEDQDGYHTICAAGVFGIPFNVEDPERSAVITDAMSYYSYKKVRPAFLEKTVQHKVLDSDPDAYRVLEILHEGKLFDAGFNFGYDPQIPFAPNAAYSVIVEEDSADFPAYYAAHREQWQKHYDDLCDLIAKVE